MHKLCVHHLCNSVKTFTPPLHECRNIYVERWTIRLLLSVGAVARCAAREKALHETRCSYRQAMGAGRQSFLWDYRGSSSLCFRPILEAHLSAFGGGSPTEHMILPSGSQAWNSPAAIHTQPHCKWGCSPQPGVLEGNHLLLGVQRLLSSTVFHRFHVEGYSCAYMLAPCVWHLK